MSENIKIDITAEDKTKSALQSTRKGLQDVTSSVFSLQTAIGGIGIGLFTQQIMEAGIAMQRLENALKAATGSAEGAGRELSFVRAEAQRLGLELETASKSFVTIAASAKGTALEGQGVRDIFTSVSEASTVLGLTADETQGALLAISQMMSKGKVSAEELRGQLGERLPGAFQTAAKAMGVSTMKLDEMLKAGELMADDFLPKFATELRKTFAEGLPSAIDGAQANINRFKNQLFQLKVDFAQSGFMEAILGGMGAISDAFKDPGLKAALESIGQSFKNISDDGTLMSGSLAVVVGTFKSLVVGALTVQYAMEQAGNGIGAVAAAVAFAAEGEFAKAKEALSLFVDDASADVDRLAAKIKQIDLFSLPGTKGLADYYSAGVPLSGGGSRNSAESASSSGAAGRNIGDELQSLRDKLEAEEELRQEAAQRTFEREEEENARRFEKTGQDLESLRESLYTEEEELWASYERRLGILNEAESAGLLNKTQWANYELQLADQLQKKLGEVDKKGLSEGEKFEKLSFAEKLRYTNAFVGEKTALVAGHNKTMFQINKAARLAEATVDTAAGVAKTLSTYAYPYSLIMAAAQAAAGAIYIGQIASTQFSDTSSLGVSSIGYGAGTPSSPVITQPSYDRSVYDSGLSQNDSRQMSQQVNVHFHGNINASDDAYIRDVLIPGITKAARDGVTQ